MVILLAFLHALWPPLHKVLAIAHANGSTTHYCVSCGKKWSTRE